MAQAHRPPSNPTPQAEQHMDKYRELDNDQLRSDLDSLFNLEPATEESMTVREVLMVLATATSTPQPRRGQSSAQPGKSPTVVTSSYSLIMFRP